MWVAVGGVEDREMQRRRSGDDSHRDSQAYVISEKAVSDQTWMGTKDRTTWTMRSLSVLSGGQALQVIYVIPGPWGLHP